MYKLLVIILFSQISIAQLISGETVVSIQDDMMLTVTVNVNNDLVTFTFTGRNGAWFGFGFGSSIQSDTYAIVIDKDGNVEERKLGNHTAGNVLTNTLSVVENTVLNDIRTVTLTRSINGLNGDYYSFPTLESTFDGIWARGPDGNLFGMHLRFGSYSIMLTNTDPIFINGFE